MDLGFSRFDLYSKISMLILIFFSFNFVDIYSEVVLTSSFGFGGELSIFDLIFC
jgi:hypothetical protein